MEVLRWPHGGHGDCASARAGYGVRRWVAAGWGACRRAIYCVAAPPEALSLRSLSWGHGLCTERLDGCAKAETQVLHKKAVTLALWGKRHAGRQGPTPGHAHLRIKLLPDRGYTAPCRPAAARPRNGTGAIYLFETQSGREEPDDSGRWAVQRIVRVERPPTSRRGRPLRALVNWEGTDEHGMPWHDSWVGIAMLTADQKAEARRMEREAYASVESRQGREKRQKTGKQGQEEAIQRWENRLRRRKRTLFDD